MSTVGQTYGRHQTANRRLREPCERALQLVPCQLLTCYHGVNSQINFLYEMNSKVIRYKFPRIYTKMPTIAKPIVVEIVCPT